MGAEQLELFPLSQEEINARRIEEVFTRVENVRKGTYGKINAQGKIILDLLQRMEILESNVCKNKDTQ